MSGARPGDVFMSFWNFYGNFTPQLLNVVNGVAGPGRYRAARGPDNIHAFWRSWMRRGWFEWEAQGFPVGSVLHHAQSWWDFRHLPKIQFISPIFWAT
jgi:aryl sulfotransferase